MSESEQLQALEKRMQALESMLLPQGGNLAIKVPGSLEIVVGGALSIRAGAMAKIVSDGSMDIDVGSKFSSSIGSTAQATIGSRCTVTTGSDLSATVQGNYQLAVGGQARNTIGGGLRTEVGGGHDLTIGLYNKLTVGGHFTIDSKSHMFTLIHGNHEVDIRAGLKVEVGKDYSFSVDGNSETKVGKQTLLAYSQSVATTAGDAVSFKVGSAGLDMKKDGFVEIKGKDIGVRASGNIVLRGSKISQN